MNEDGLIERLSRVIIDNRSDFSTEKSIDVVSSGFAEIAIEIVKLNIPASYFLEALAELDSKNSLLRWRSHLDNVTHCLMAGLSSMLSYPEYHCDTFNYLNNNFTLFKQFRYRDRFMLRKGSTDQPNFIRDENGNLRDEGLLNKWIGGAKMADLFATSAFINNDPEALRHILSISSVKKHLHPEDWVYDELSKHEASGSKVNLSEIKSTFKKRKGHAQFVIESVSLLKKHNSTISEFRDLLKQFNLHNRALETLVIRGSQSDINSKSYLLTAAICETGFDQYHAAVMQFEGEGAYFDSLSSDYQPIKSTTILLKNY